MRRWTLFRMTNTFKHTYIHAYRAGKANKEVVDLISDDESEAPLPKAQTGMCVYTCIYVCMHAKLTCSKDSQQLRRIHTYMHSYDRAHNTRACTHVHIFVQTHTYKDTRIRVDDGLGSK
jgi:hypothetical protein